MKQSVVAIFFFILSTAVYGQDTTNEVQLAFEAGSAKELMKYFNDRTEVKFDGEGSSHLISEAEPVFREFFNENPPTTFEYIHKGQSPKGLKYNIAQYTSGENTYRILMLLKQNGDQYLIDNISLNQE